MNHRFALYDAVLIKDNHIAIAGSVAEAIRRAKAHVGHMVKIEVEVDTLDQLSEAMEIGTDAVLLDNMSPELLKQAVDSWPAAPSPKPRAGSRRTRQQRLPQAASIFSPSAGSRIARRAWISGWMRLNRKMGKKSGPAETAAH